MEFIFVGFIDEDCRIPKDEAGFVVFTRSYHV